jgi:hypothetical protein
MSTPAGKIQFLIFCTSLFIESIGLIMCDTGTPKDMIGSTNDRPVTNMIKTTLSGPKLNEAYLANRSIHIPPEPALDTMFGGLMEGMWLGGLREMPTNLTLDGRGEHLQIGGVRPLGDYVGKGGLAKLTDIRHKHFRVATHKLDPLPNIKITTSPEKLGLTKPFEIRPQRGHPPLLILTAGL